MNRKWNGVQLVYSVTNAPDLYMTDLIIEGKCN